MNWKKTRRSHKPAPEKNSGSLAACRQWGGHTGPKHEPEENNTNPSGGLS